MVAVPRYVDVNVFIYWLGGQPVFGGRSCEWIKRVERARRGEYVTSTLTVYKLLVIVVGLAGGSLANRRFIEGVVKPMRSLRGLTLTSLDGKAFTEALTLMKKFMILSSTP